MIQKSNIKRCPVHAGLTVGLQDSTYILMYRTEHNAHFENIHTCLLWGNLFFLTLVLSFLIFSLHLLLQQHTIFKKYFEDSL